MIKSELVEKLAGENPHLFQRDIENIVNAILDEVNCENKCHGTTDVGGYFHLDAMAPPFACSCGRRITSLVQNIFMTLKDGLVVKWCFFMRVSIMLAA